MACRWTQYILISPRHLTFDKVNHRLLLRKLAKLGFEGSFLTYLTGCEQFVSASGSQSRRFSVRSGVPQSSHLRPLLFILFKNYVFLFFKSLRILLYADDFKIFFPVATVATVTLRMRRLNLMFFLSASIA
jgi:hypothetical protein